MRFSLLLLVRVSLLSEFELVPEVRYVLLLLLRKIFSPVPCERVLPEDQNLLRVPDRFEFVKEVLNFGAFQIAAGPSCPRLLFSQIAASLFTTSHTRTAGLRRPVRPWL